MLRSNAMPVAKKKTAAKKATKKAAPKKKAAKKTVKKTVKKAAPKKKAAAKKKPSKKTAKKTAKKAAKKKAAKKKPAKKAASKRKPNPAFMRPMAVSEDLGAIVGNKPMPRTEITKKLWDYIKKNNLQDNANRRMINADEKLKKVFGGKKQVSMFDMTKLVSKHMK